MKKKKMITIIGINIITGIIIITYGSKIGDRGGERIIERIIGINLSIISYYIYKIIIKGEERRIRIGGWIEEVEKGEGYNIIIDMKGITMISLIMIIGYIVIKYSYWYMPLENIFKGYLLIFQVTMIILVSSKTIIGIYIGWEWVGVMSYILISYWNRNRMNGKSGIKAIIYNKIGDIGYILLINHLFYTTNNSYKVLNYNSITIGYIENIIYNVVPIYIMIASMAKSAQYIMHPWLGDAMAGPTPVSALLHAATMVTAGIVLINRTRIYESNIWESIMIIGIITVIFGGIVGIGQNDIKKIIAYSTCSQLGYMYLISIYPTIPTNISIYHLYTHGFFKALLFLSAGIIIHNNNEQDIRRINLTIRNNPYSYLFLLFSSLSLIAIPYSSGYYSKEIIIYSIESTYIYIISLIGAMLTTLYSIKLLYNTYIINTTIKNEKEEEIPITLISILSILLSGSLYLGNYIYNIAVGEIIESIDSIRTMNILPIILIIISIIIFIISKNKRIINWVYNEAYVIIYEIINRRTYIDPIINKVSDYILSKSFSTLYLSIDKGILEYLGPLGFFRALSSLSSLSLLSPLSLFSSLPILSLLLSYLYLYL